MTTNKIRSRLMSAAIFALTLALAAACSSQAPGNGPNYANGQHDGTFSTLAGGY